MKPLFEKPVGPGKKHWGCIGTTSEVVCEICGTVHEELPEDACSYAIFNFLGYQVVGECCGALLDKIFEEIGDDCCTFFIEDFAEDPMDPRFLMLRFILPDCLNKALQNIKGVECQVEEFIDLVKRIPEK